MKIIGNQSFKTTAPSQSGTYRKSLLTRPPHPPKVKIIQNKSISRNHILPKWKVTKFALSIPMHHPKVEFVENEDFQDHCTFSHYKLFKITFKTTFSQSENYLKSVILTFYIPAKWKLLKFSILVTTKTSQNRHCKNSILSRPPYPLKMETVKIQSLQDHYILPKWKVSRISSFKTTISSQSENFPYQSLWDHHTLLPKWTLLKISHFSTSTSSKSGQYPKYILPNWKL